MEYLGAVIVVGILLFWRLWRRRSRSRARVAATVDVTRLAEVIKQTSRYPRVVEATEAKTLGAVARWPGATMVIDLRAIDLERKEDWQAIREALETLGPPGRLRVWRVEAEKLERMMNRKGGFSDLCTRLMRASAGKTEDGQPPGDALVIEGKTVSAATEYLVNSLGFRPYVIDSGGPLPLRVAEVSDGVFVSGMVDPTGR